jgi:hypothetical protein
METSWKGALPGLMAAHAVWVRKLSGCLKRQFFFWWNNIAPAPPVI